MDRWIDYQTDKQVNKSDRLDGQTVSVDGLGKLDRLKSQLQGVIELRIELTGCLHSLL